MNVSYQTKKDLQAVKVADNDMIQVTQKKQQIEMILLVWSEINWQQIERIISNKTDLQAVEVADDDMGWVIQKKQWIEMILLVWYDFKLTTNWTYHIKQRQTYQLKK